MPVFESDVCIVGGGISSAMFAQRLSELRAGVSIIIVEAGESIFDRKNRDRYRQRASRYGENPWPGDVIADQAATNIISRTMAVGGSALHWGGTCNRFSEEDLRLKSLYGLYVDWPLEWSELERFYCEAERRIGVSGEPSPFKEDARSQPYPMGPLPLTWNLRQLKTWGDQSGIPFQPTPQAKNTRPYDGRAVCVRCGTCDICPTGARYSPDFTFKQLLAAKKITLHDRTLVRRLVPREGASSIAAAQAVHRDRPDEPLEYRARQFIVASGYAWSAHLLLLSTSSRYPAGLANRSGLVGKYMNGHSFTTAMFEVPVDIYPGMNPDYGLISRQFFRCATDVPYVRNDLRIWENPGATTPRLKDDGGRMLFGDEVIADWRARKPRGTARVRAYTDVHPDKTSELTLDQAVKNRWGDPMPRIEHRLDMQTQARAERTDAQVRGIFDRLAKLGDTKIVSTSKGQYLDHPAGGCRMGHDPATSVCDSYGQTHDHDNLFVVGAPTLPSAGCTNGTLTFVALTLRSADRVAETFPKSGAG
ncbi:MAG: GMC family oxidoreductase [Acidobacteria bacterium]|nr:GMC family oxidoreductase [Acidobacteriota bacterium]